MKTHPRHAKGTHAKVLLTSVFGPYAQDDSFGSRSINPMELYHNQVTRVQGPFSLRMFHRSWGIMMIQANISAPCTLLDFPDLDRFIQELKNQEYDIVGISSIIPNLRKVQKMCDLIREHLPRCTIVVGGHIASIPDLDQRIDADHIVRGDGIGWFRRFLGQDDSHPIDHPEIVSGFGARSLGLPLRSKPGDVAAVVIPSVGCPMGCTFCSTSAMFGGKGKFLNFFEKGREIFDIMCRLENKLAVQSFFVMDENFLLHRKRALELLDLMKQHGKSWSLYVFSSASALKLYTMEELIGLGIAWVWLGLEGEKSAYQKLQGIETGALVRSLQAHGIRVLGSSIIGLETHTPENIDQVIDFAVKHNTDFHQFMLYTPMPGTPLHGEHLRRGTLYPETEEADIHGQFQFNFRHPHISREQSGEFLLRAFRRDYEVNGPSVFRIARTVLQGWQRYKNHPDQRIRRRFYREARVLPLVFAGAIWAMEKYFHHSNRPLTEKIRALRAEILREYKVKARILGAIVGRVLRLSIWMEQRRLLRGWTYEPPLFVERRNW